MSKNDDLVRRLRALSEAAQKSMDTGGREEVHPFEVQEVCEASLDAIERGAAQGMGEAESRAVGAFVYAMQEPQASANGEKPALYNTNVNYVIRRALEAALSTPPAPAPDAGEGWKLVPVKPTNEMIGAAVRATEPLEYDDDICRAEFRRTYHAMISAAPAPQPPAVEAEAVERRSMVETFGGTAMMPREDGEWVRFTDHEATIKKEIERLREGLAEVRHLINTRGSHRAIPLIDALLSDGDPWPERAEASKKALREKVEKVIEDMPESYYRTQLAAALRALREGGVDG